MAGQMLDAKSRLVGKSELDLFTLPPTQVAIDNGYFQEVHLKNTLQDNGPFEFELNADNAYIDLSRNFIYMVMSVTKKNGTSIGSGAGVGEAADNYNHSTINLLGQTFFKQIKFFLGGKLVTDSMDGYAYRAYLETLLNHSQGAKETWLESEGWFEDRAGKMNDKTNQGFILRSHMIDDSRKFELLAPLHSELCNQERLLLPSLNVRIELHRNSDDFLLLSPDDGENDLKLKIHHMSWFIRRVEPMKSLALAIEAQLVKEPARYPIRRMVVKVLQVDAGRQDLTPTLISQGQLPRRIIFGLVDTTAYHGNLKLNPLEFRHFNLKEYVIYAGNLTYPRAPITMDFDNDWYTRAYLSMFDTLGLNAGDRTNNITYDEWKRGYCIHGVDLSADGQEASHWHLLRTGPTYIKLLFDAPLASSVKVIVMLEYDNVIEISRTRLVTHDFEV